MKTVQNSSQVINPFRFRLISFLLSLVYFLEERLCDLAVDTRFEPKSTVESGYDISRSPEPPEEIPAVPFQKEYTDVPFWKILLAQKKEQGIKVEPVKYRIYPLRTEAMNCRKCQAPKEYLRNHGFYRPKMRTEIYPRHTCKVCLAEYAPGAPRHIPTLRCSWCSYALSRDKKKSFGDICVCRNKDCLYLSSYGKRYSETDWKIPELPQQVSGSMDVFARLRTSPVVTNEILHLFMLGLPGSTILSLLRRKFGTDLVTSEQTILNIVHKMAEVIREHQDITVLPMSGLTFNDESYVKTGEGWHYLFRILDLKTGAILIDDLYAKRNGLSAILSHREYFAEAQRRALALKSITDSSPLYPLTYRYAKKQYDLNVEHIQVQGIDDEKYPSPYRGTKQGGERQFGELKALLKRKRGFSSVQGAKDFLTLYRFHYNHLDRRLKEPPCPLKLKNGSLVTEWIQVIRYFMQQKE